jgi:hypothetical protein
MSSLAFYHLGAMSLFFGLLCGPAWAASTTVPDVLDLRAAFAIPAEFRLSGTALWQPRTTAYYQRSRLTERLACPPLAPCLLRLDAGDVVSVELEWGSRTLRRSFVGVVVGQ